MFKTIINIIKYPKILIIIFDVENTDDFSNNDNNLKILQKGIIDLLNYIINIDNKLYFLIGLINMPGDNHYTNTLINTK